MPGPIVKKNPAPETLQAPQPIKERKSKIESKSNRNRMQVSSLSLLKVVDCITMLVSCYITMLISITLRLLHLLSFRSAAAAILSGGGGRCYLHSRAVCPGSPVSAVPASTCWCPVCSRGPAVLSVRSNRTAAAVCVCPAGPVRTGAPVCCRINPWTAAVRAVPCSAAILPTVVKTTP